MIKAKGNMVADTLLGKRPVSRAALLLPALLGCAHALSDGSAGWMLGVLSGRLPSSELGALLLVYNGLGFATQPFVGWLVDRGRWARPAVLLGLGAQILALFCIGAAPWFAVAVAGLGSAFFHVGAGSIALGATPGKAAGVGLFAAPGVLGLGIGGACAIAGWNAAAALCLMLLTLLIILAWTLPSGALVHGTPHREHPENRHAVLEAHDLLMIGLLAAIALRSLVWTTYSWIIEGQSESLVLLAVAAAAGKALGGPLADRFGWRRWCFAALLCAAALTIVGHDNPAFVYISAALLQSATPATVAALLTWMPRRPALASGLAFGLAIAFGGAPFAFGLGALMLAKPVTIAALALGTLLSLALVAPRQRSRRVIALPQTTMTQARSST